MLFEPFRIKNVEFKNRILRSSIGGRTANYDGRVSPAWLHFEKKFAEGGVAGIISATISINQARMSPLQYPTLYDDRFVGPLGNAIKQIKAAGDCKYIIQLGDTGGHTHTSLKPQDADRISASAYFDFLFGYQNRTRPMSIAEIRRTVKEFKHAARRAVAAGCDGLEITASKGYLIHQFLNPVINRRTDEYGGSIENRFRLLGEIVEAVRGEIGREFLFGIRLSARDFNIYPFNLRIPLSWPPPSWRDYFVGNDLPEMTYYARKLEQLGIDYLHVSSGFGFPNPKESPGDYPDDGFHIFVNAYRYLSEKNAVRATIFNFVPTPIRKAVFGWGWGFVPAANADLAAAIRRVVNIPVIANGGFQDRDVIEGALNARKCDMIAMARPLLANPDLITQLRHANRPANPCSFCTLCCSQTAVFPLGCYDQRRFRSQEEMMEQIFSWTSPDEPFPVHPPAPPAIDAEQMQ
jgi:2,4-dienoyl-CoA reductase (NADPH2)